ncbi:DUF4331 family protein [Nocardioides sp.]|uniref:DUF4331 family protein n=1 Tax=Nocardioides sp. TaxID=35761 RepID=UPI0037837FA4
MSNHFTGLSLGPPLGDQRLDLCDLYAFQAPGDPTRTVLILNANPQADALHPDAVYRLGIDNDGDLLDDVAISFVFAPPVDGAQSYDVHVATGAEARSAEPVGTKVVAGARASFGPEPEIVSADGWTFSAGARSDAFFFDFDGIKNLFDIRGNRNFTAPRFGGEAPWTGIDSNAEANVFSMAVEAPTEALLGGGRELHVWGRCSVRRDGRLVHVDRAGHPSVSSFFNTDETKEEYNASEPVHDRERWTDLFVHLMGHTGGYTREEAVAAIEAEGLLPDVLTFDPTRPARYPNGRVFTDDVIDHRLQFLSKGDVPPPGLAPHQDTLEVFPYLGHPHPTSG